MTLSIAQTVTAVGANGFCSFQGIGGSAPYSYAVIAGGAGGTVDSSTGNYTAPTQASSSPNHAYDIIRVTDSVSSTATAQILVGTPLILFCDIIQKGMSLTADRVYLWDQKIFQPSDYDLYIAVSVPMCKPFGNNNYFMPTDTGGSQIQSVNMLAQLDIDIISRGPAARDRKEEVILALRSIYAEQQMEANSFYIGNVSTNFINLSYIDGAAIPYRFKITCQMQYAVTKTSTVSYFDTFSAASLNLDTN